MPALLRTTAILVLSALSATSLAAQSETFRVDPEKSQIHFLLGDVLHTVRGTFRVKEGTIRLDEKTGALQGKVVIDAASGDSGSTARDRKMKAEILEVQKYPLIAFSPKRLMSNIAPIGDSSTEVDGDFNLHGAPHTVTVPMNIHIDGQHWRASVHFIVPYVKWGLKDPSTFILRVGKEVSIDLELSGDLVQ